MSTSMVLARQPTSAAGEVHARRFVGFGAERLHEAPDPRGVGYFAHASLDELGAP